MAQQRDLSRTRERIMAAAQKEFAASGFAGARTDAIARRARVNERMIFYCFDSKEGLYRAVLKCKLSARACMIESMPDEDLISTMVNGFEQFAPIPTHFECGSGRRSTEASANWS